MDRIASVIGRLEDNDERQVFRLAGMFADPLTRKIMAKLASPQSPISVDSIPPVLEGERGAVISRLSKLEQAGLLNSEKTPTKNGFCKKYSINDKGKSLVSKYMKAESKLFQ